MEFIGGFLGNWNGKSLAMDSMKALRQIMDKSLREDTRAQRVKYAVANCRHCTFENGAWRVEGQVVYGKNMKKEIPKNPLEFGLLKEGRIRPEDFRIANRRLPNRKRLPRGARRIV